MDLIGIVIAIVAIVGLLIASRSRELTAPVAPPGPVRAGVRPRGRCCGLAQRRGRRARRSRAASRGARTEAVSDASRRHVSSTSGRAFSSALSTTRRTRRSRPRISSGRVMVERGYPADAGCECPRRGGIGRPPGCRRAIPPRMRRARGALRGDAARTENLRGRWSISARVFESLLEPDRELAGDALTEFLRGTAAPADRPAPPQPVCPARRRGTTRPWDRSSASELPVGARRPARRSAS